MAETAASLARKHEAVLAALLVEPTITAAAAKAGVPERTVYRWMAEPDFSAAYRQARREAVSQATARLQAASGSMVDVLRSVAEDPNAPASSRVTAARAVLEITFRAVETEDVMERLEALETAQADLARVTPHVTQNGHRRAA